MPWFDVLCVPSLVEPFGTVAAEALAAGTPAVVTDSGGMPEYVTPGRNGEVVPPGAPEQLADALERVLAGAPAMADAARADAGRFATARRGARDGGAPARGCGAMKVALDLRVLDGPRSPSAGSGATRRAARPRWPPKASRSSICVGRRGGEPERTCSTARRSTA